MLEGRPRDGWRRSGVGISGLSSSATTLACSASTLRLVQCAHSMLAQFAAQRLAQLGDRLQRLAQLGDRLQRLVVDGLTAKPHSTVPRTSLFRAFLADLGR